MTSSQCPFSGELVRFAESDGHTRVHCDSGVWGFFNGFDVEIFLHVDDDVLLLSPGRGPYAEQDVFRLTIAERNWPERFMMRAGQMPDVDRFLAYWFASSLRSTRRQPRIWFPRTADQVRPEWRVERADFGWEVADADGRRARFNYEHNAVLFSWIGDASIEDIEATFTSSDGLPLAPGMRIGAPREG